MPRKPRKPGFWFWVWTFTLGAFNPDKGKHRVNSKMTELHQGIEERESIIAKQQSDIQSLKEDLNAAVAHNRRLRRALHMDTVVNTRTPSWSRESADEEVDTVSIPVVSTN